MIINKSIHNYALRRNIELCIAIEGELHIIPFPDSNECASVAYMVSEQGLTFIKQWDNTLEDLPAFIGSEEKLKELINYVATYWFKLYDYDTYAISDCNGVTTLLDCDGYPCPPSQFHDYIKSLLMPKYEDRVLD